MSAAAVEVGPFAGVRAWWQLDRAGMLRTLGLVLSLLALLWLLPSLVERGGAAPLIGNVVIHAYVLGWMLLASLAVRTVGCREVLVAGLTGLFLVPTLVFAPAWVVLRFVDVPVEIQAVYGAPLLEESALLLAVGLIAWRLNRSLDRAPSVLDLTILGFAVGTGYAIHEDALWGRMIASWPEVSVVGAFQGPYGWLFPTFIDDATTRGSAVFTYQAGHAAVLGMAVGAVVVLGRRRPWVRWLLPVMLAYAMLDHGLANHRLQNPPSPLRFLIADGHVFALLLVVGFWVVLGVELWRRQRSPIPAPAMGIRGVRTQLGRAADPYDLVVRLLAAGRYHRARNAMIVEDARRPDGPRPRPGELYAMAAFLVHGRWTLRDDGPTFTVATETDTNGPPVPPLRTPSGPPGPLPTRPSDEAPPVPPMPPPAGDAPRQPPAPPATS